MHDVKLNRYRYTDTDCDEIVNGSMRSTTIAWLLRSSRSYLIIESCARRFNRQVLSRRFRLCHFMVGLFLCPLCGLGTRERIDSREILVFLLSCTMRFRSLFWPLLLLPWKLSFIKNINYSVFSNVKLCLSNEYRTMYYYYCYYCYYYYYYYYYYLVNLIV